MITNTDKSNKDVIEKQSNKKDYAKYIAKGIATIAVCGMGAYVMQITDGKTGIGWAIFGVIGIWGS